MGVRFMAITIPDYYFSYFEAIGKRCVLPENHVVFYESEDANDIYLIIKGRVRAYLSSPSGKEINIEVLKKGRIFGDASFLNHSVRKTNIITITETELIKCHIDELIPILQNNRELMILMMQHLTSTCNYLTHTIERLVNYDSTQKVADFLLIETENGKKSIPYTHEDVAECLNMNRVTVTRIMKKFKDQELIDYDYGTIHVIHADLLHKMLV